jgi:thioredoxin 1
MIFKRKGGEGLQPEEAAKKGKRMPAQEEIDAFKKFAAGGESHIAEVPQNAEERRRMISEILGTKNLIEELEKEQKKHANRGLRNFLRRHMEGIRHIGIVAAISALSVFGTLSPIPLEKITGYDYSAESAREEAIKKGWGYEDAEYLAKIIHGANFATTVDGTYTTSTDILKRVTDNPKFEAKMLPFLGILFLENKDNEDSQIRGATWLGDFLSKEDFDPEVVMGAIKAYDELKGDIAEHISKLSKYGKIGAEGYVYVRNIERVEYEELLNDITNLLRNPNFAERAIGSEEFKMIASSLNEYSYSMRHGKGMLFKDIRSVVSAYYANPEFGKDGKLERWGPQEFAEKIFSIYKGLGAKEYSGVSFLLAGFMENPNFSEQDVTEENVGKLYKISERMGERFAEADWNAAYGFAKSRISYPPSGNSGKFQIERIVGWAGKKEDAAKAAPIPSWITVEKIPGKVESALKISESLVGRSGEIDDKKATKIWKDLDFFSRRLWENDLADIAEMSASKPGEFAKIYDAYCSENRKKCWEALDALTDIRAAFGHKARGGSYAPLLEDVLYAKRRDAPAQTMYSAFSQANSYSAGNENPLDYYEKGRDLAKRLGAPKTIATWINFAFGCATIGEEKTERLYREFGIEYFTRYGGYLPSNRQAIESMLQRLTEVSWGERDLGKGIALVATTKADWNGAFSYAGRGISEIVDKYRTFAVEVKGDWELFEKIMYISRIYGKIDVLVLRGHGDPCSVNLGAGCTYASDLDTTDYGRIASLKPAFGKNAQIVLDSCSTGRWENGGIARVISKAVRGSRVFAPGTDSGIVSITCLERGGLDVDYAGAECKVFCETGHRKAKLNSNNFERETAEGIVLVDFWAPWCGPCKKLMPVFEDLSETMPDVKFAKVNTDDNEELSEKLAITGIPTLILFKDGKEIARRSGGSKEDLEKWVLSKTGQVD